MEVENCVWRITNSFDAHQYSVRHQYHAAKVAGFVHAFDGHGDNLRVGLDCRVILSGNCKTVRLSEGRDRGEFDGIVRFFETATGAGPAGADSDTIGVKSNAAQSGHRLHLGNRPLEESVNLVLR